MLSRVAERVYWLARYIERAENSARLVNAFTNQMLDLPTGLAPGWRQLVDIIGCGSSFEKHYQTFNERSTVGFLVADDFSPSSIRTSVSLARENMRTTRELLPTRAWLHCNELYLYVKRHAAEAVPRRGRYGFLKEVIFRCQQLTGLLAGTMSHDVAYDLVCLGRNLERADMTSRIVDSAIFILMPRRLEPGRYDSLLWVNVLKSSSAYQMYRQHVRGRVEGSAVLKFLLQDRDFPRAVARAVAEAEIALKNLPRNEGPLRRIAVLRERIENTNIDTMDFTDMHAFIDSLQLALNQVHEEIFRTWFSIRHPVRRGQVQTTKSAQAFL
jgi:uncharacterized alpha-E superfamily protein